MSPVGFLNDKATTFNWIIPNWAERVTCREYYSPCFYFNGSKWYLRIDKGTIEYPKNLSFYLMLTRNIPKSTETLKKMVSFNIKIDDLHTNNATLSIEKAISLHLFSSDSGGWGSTAFTGLSTLEPLLNAEGALSITVTMTIPNAEIKKHDSIVPYELFADYIESSEFSDISFRVFAHEESDVDDEEEEGQINNGIVHAHKIVLATASPWFKLLFTNGMQETSQKMINIYGVSLDIFKRLLHYCYVHDLRIKDLNDAYKIGEAAGRFQLVNAREEAFYAVRQEINEDNVWEVWEYADKSDDRKTADACICFINKHMKSVILSDSFLRAKVDKIQTVFDIEITNNTNNSNIVKETDLYEAAMRWIKEQKKEINDKEVADMTKQFETDVADIMKNIRFTMIPIEYLIKSVETDDFAMSFDTLRRKLTEGYKYHAASGTSFAQKHKPRRKI